MSLDNKLFESEVPPASYFTHLDPSSFDELPEDLRANLLFALPSAILAIANGTSFILGKPSEAEGEFPFDGAGLTYIEEYIRNRVRPQVITWSGPDRIGTTRVRTKSGLATSKPEELTRVASLFWLAGLVYGQCMAQMFGLKWNVRDGKLLVGTVYPFRKPWAYARNGAEDGLTSFARSYANRNSGKALRIVERYSVETGFVRKEDEFIQVWHGGDSSLCRIIVMDSQRKPLVTIEGEELARLSVYH